MKTTGHAPLASLFSLASGGANTRIAVKGLALVAGSLIIALSARVQVPMWPVPMTMQVLAVLGIAMAFGARIGVATVALYIAEGAIGLPVFAGGAGPAYLVGPTGGFLAGFLVAAGVTGWLAEGGWTRRPLTGFAIALLGVAIIHALGFSWLATLAGPGTALGAGVLPFLPGDVVKAALLAVVLSGIGPRSR